jgi:hypothetical protein
MRFAKYFIAAIAASTSAAAWPAQYRDIHAVYAPFSDLKQFQYLHAAVKVVSAQSQTRVEDIRAVIHANGHDIAVSVASNAIMDFPVNDALLRENPAVEFNQPKGSISLKPEIEAYCAPRLQFSYGVYDAMDAQYKRWQDTRIGWFARMHMARPKALLIRFPVGVQGTATVALPQGALHLAMNSQREIRIAENSEWTRLNPLISLNALPEKIALGME